jgi:hypothetical protein
MAKAGKIPKKVAGIKIPKKLRKSGEKLIEQAKSPQGQQVIASGLAIAAAIAAKKKAAPVAPHLTPAAPDGVGKEPPSGTATDTAPIVDALSAAASAFMQGLAGRKA